MAIITIKISTENNAFREYPTEEIQTALEQAGRIIYDLFKKFSREGLENINTGFDFTLHDTEGEQMGTLNATSAPANTDYTAICAWGSWHKLVPAGYVGVKATKGRRDPLTGKYPDNTTAFFYVKQEKYNARNGYYVIQDDDHPAPPIH